MSANSRPAKPGMAIVVSAFLLALTIAGALWLTRARNRPVLLGPVHAVDAMPGIRIAWPEEWEPFRLQTRPGTQIVAVAEPQQDRQPGRVLMLLTRRIADEAVSPHETAELIMKMVHQLGFVPAGMRPMVAETSLADLPAVDVVYPIQYRDEVWWVQIRATCQPNGRAVGLILINPTQIAPSDTRVFDAVSDSLELGRQTSTNTPTADEEEAHPLAQPI